MSDIQDKHKPLKKVRELAEPMPRGRLIPITTVLQAISELTNGMASIPELVEVLGRIYDFDKMMMYSGGSYGLASAIDGSPHDEFSGYNDRASMASDLFNSQYWMGKGASSWPGSIGDHADILITRADGVTLAGALWEFFAPGQAFDVDRYNELTEARGKVSIKEEPPDSSGRELGVQAVYQPSTPQPPDAGSEETPLLTRERNTLLIIIAALCKEAGYDFTKAAKTAGIIHGAAASMGVSIGNSTIEGHLKKIPDALEARTR